MLNMNVWRFRTFVAEEEKPEAVEIKSRRHLRQP